MNWTALLTQEMTATYSATEKMLDLLQDSDLDWKPASGDNWMTVGQLLVHLNASCGTCCQGFVVGDWGVAGDGGEPESQMPAAEKMPTIATVAEAKAGLAADRKLGFQMLEKAGEEKLATLEMAAPWEPDASRLLGHHLLQMVNHLAVHKAQLFYYLKMMGHKVDTMTLWGM